MYAHTIKVVELPPADAQTEKQTTKPHVHTLNGSTKPCLLTSVQSPDVQVRYNSIAELSKKQSENCVCAKNAFDSLMRDKHVKIIIEMYDKVANICEANDFLQETSVLRLMENIWIAPRCSLFAKTALSNILKTDRKYRIFFGNRISLEANFEIVFDMIHFARTHVPNYARHLEKIQTQNMIKLFKIIPDKQITLEVFKNLNPYFEYLDFFEKLIDAFVNQQVDEHHILKYIKLHIAEGHLKKVPHYLRMLVDVVDKNKFDSIFQEIVKEFDSEICEETLKKFVEDVRDVMTECSEHQFMRMMENVYIKEKRNAIVDILFRRMDILDSECETMRTRFAMTLIRNAYSPKFLFRTKQSLVIRYILKYTYREIPKEYNTCVVSLRSAKMAITMIHYFVESFETFSKQSKNVENDLKERLTGFQNILTKFMISSRDGLACEITKGIIQNISCVLGPKNAESDINITPYLNMAQKVAGFKDAQNYINQGSYMKIRDGLFYN